MAVGRFWRPRCDIERYEKECICDLVSQNVGHISYLFTYRIARFLIYSRKRRALSRHRGVGFIPLIVLYGSG